MTDTQLETLYSQLNEYILSHFEFFWSIVFGILGIIGVALYFIARSMVESWLPAKFGYCICVHAGK